MARPGAVDHAGDIAIERNVVQLVLRGGALHFIFLAGIAPGGQLLLAEQRVVLDVDLGVERHQLAVAGHDQRIDFDQARVLLEIELVERLRDRGELIDLLALEARARTRARGTAKAAARRPDARSRE